MSDKPRKFIKVTYSTLSSPDPLLHEYFDEAVAEVKANAGKTYPMLIGGEERMGAKAFPKISPVDTNLVLGYFQKGTTQDANDAVAAAKAAWPLWRDMPWQDRVAIMRKAADLISEPLVALECNVDDMPGERFGFVMERLFADGLCLPSGSNLTEPDLQRVAEAVRRVFARAAG